MKIIITFAMSHTWFWPQTCITKLLQFDPGIEDYEIIIMDNAWDWSPAYRGIPLFAEGWTYPNVPGKMFSHALNIFTQKTKNPLLLCNNLKHSKWHGTALDFVIENFDADYLFTMESDVMVLRDDWLKWYLDKMKLDDYAVGHWHGEQFINPSATLYNMKILKQANEEFKANKDPNMYWGPNFERSESIIPHYEKFLEDVGPFSEKRGFPPGSILKRPPPTGQMRGPGWYEPGQQLHHWAIEHGSCAMNGYGFTITNCLHEVDQDRQIPIGTFYTDKGIDEAYAVHLWGGTRALDILKHPLSDPTVVNNFEYWLTREAKYWKMVVPEDIQKQTIELIRKYGWYDREMTEREKEAVKVVQEAYKKGGVEI